MGFTKYFLDPAGITATNESLSHAVELIRRHLPGVYVTALEVTGSSVGSVFTGCDRQVGRSTFALTVARARAMELTRRAGRWTSSAGLWHRIPTSSESAST